MLNKRGFIDLIIIIVIILLLTGTLYFKFSDFKFEIGSKKSNASLNVAFNGSDVKTSTHESVQTPSGTDG